MQLLIGGPTSFTGRPYDFLRNDALDARGYFRPAPLPKDLLRRNQFGGVLSGPVRHDKTFFLINYEGQRQLQQSGQTNIVPTLAQRSGDFSASSKPVIDPLSGTPFPGNIIPASRINPVSV